MCNDEFEIEVSIEINPKYKDLVTTIKNGLYKMYGENDPDFVIDVDEDDDTIYFEFTTMGEIEDYDVYWEDNYVDDFDPSSYYGYVSRKDGECISEIDNIKTSAEDIQSEIEHFLIKTGLDEDKFYIDLSYSDDTIEELIGDYEIEHRND